MATHSSTLAWKIPWTEEPGRLQSLGSWRVRHDWVTSLSLFTFMHWRRKWQPIPVFLPGESPGTGEPGGLPSMGSHRVEHDWSDLADRESQMLNCNVQLFIKSITLRKLKLCFSFCHCLQNKLFFNSQELWQKKGNDFILWRTFN